MRFEFNVVKNIILYNIYNSSNMKWQESKNQKKKRGLEKLSIRTRIRIIRVNMHLRPSIQFRKNLSLSFFRLTRANKNIVPKINKLEKKNREKKNLQITGKSRNIARTIDHPKLYQRLVTRSKPENQVSWYSVFH